MSSTGDTMLPRDWSTNTTMTLDPSVNNIVWPMDERHELSQAWDNTVLVAERKCRKAQAEILKEIDYW